jgi:nucleoside 2-deoxyribosyltransferase
MKSFKPDPRNPANIYLAAALFSGRETWFNLKLATCLEERGYATILPQRDGFEFRNLESVLEQRVAREKIPDIVQSIIYLLDVGFFLPNSNVVIANLDEPLDEGVLIEICHAQQLGIPVIGFRTDVRSPYGSPGEPLGGIHFFPAYQCDVFVKHGMPCGTDGQAKLEWEEFLGLLENAMSHLSAQGRLKSKASTSLLAELAKEVFGDMEDLHSKDALSILVERCASLQDRLGKLRPLILPKVK